MQIAKLKKPLLFVGLVIVYLITVLFSQQTALPFMKMNIAEHNQVRIVTVADMVKVKIPAPDNVPSAHASTIVALADDKLAVAWFGGTREGSKDTCIYFSKNSNGVWSAPKAIATRFGTSADVQRHTYRIGNPVLSVDNAGILHLYYVSTDWFGWAAGKVNHKRSTDNGNTWSEAERLAIEPTTNVSTLVRTGTVLLQNGSTLLPAYFECGSKHPDLLLMNNGAVEQKWSYPQMDGAIQPALVRGINGHLFMYCRDSNDTYKKIRFGELDDRGSLLSSGAINIPNRDSSVAAANFGDYIVIACNPVEDGGRGLLSLYASKDGFVFKKITDIENDNNEYSYPALLVTGDMLNITYSYQRKCIGFAKISLAYVERIYNQK
ncbi:MAG: sialidase family protein [Negativicutes bacterium]|jgi:predicted neuraminidase